MARDRARLPQKRHRDPQHQRGQPENARQPLAVGGHVAEGDNLQRAIGGVFRRDLVGREERREAQEDLREDAERQPKQRQHHTW